METDRALVVDPDSIGVRVRGADEWAEVQIVLYRGGWAALDALAHAEVATECPQITTPEKFVALLDSATTRFLDTDWPTTT